MTPFADWRHRLNEIPAAGLSVSREATEAERVQLAADLPLVSCEALAVEYRIKPAGRDRYALTGRLTAEITQSCVVTLDPVPARLDEPIDCKFVPAALIPDGQDEEQEVLSIEDLEPIDNGWIDVGRIVFEVFASGLDPYPRSEDAQWQPPESDGSDAPEAGPFAALADLKKKN
jgi:uncharacterized metal-binding protein YceD (DUF177 family)